MEASVGDRYAVVGAFHRAESTVAVLTPDVVSLAGTTPPDPSRTASPHDHISRRRHMPKLLSRTCQINYFTPCLCVYKGRSVRLGRASVCLCADFGQCPTMCLRKLCRVEFTINGRGRVVGETGERTDSSVFSLCRCLKIRVICKHSPAARSCISDILVADFHGSLVGMLM